MADKAFKTSRAKGTEYRSARQSTPPNHFQVWCTEQCTLEVSVCTAHITRAPNGRTVLLFYHYYQSSPCNSFELRQYAAFQLFVFFASPQRDLGIRWRLNKCKRRNPLLWNNFKANQRVDVFSSNTGKESVVLQRSYRDDKGDFCQTPHKTNTSMLRNLAKIIAWTQGTVLAFASSGFCTINIE